MSSQHQMQQPSATFGDKWRAIPGRPEYELSERGQMRRVQARNGPGPGPLLKPWRNKKTGYLYISLWRGNRGFQTTVHRLVALTFLGAPPSGKHVVAHNDGSRDNNHRSNLRWATMTENARDTFIHGTHNRGSRNGQAKIDEICAVAILKMVAMQIPRSHAAEGFGVCRQTVDDIVNRRRWRHIQ